MQLFQVMNNKNKLWFISLQPQMNESPSLTKIVYQMMQFRFRRKWESLKCYAGNRPAILLLLPADWSMFMSMGW